MRSTVRKRSRPEGRDWTEFPVGSVLVPASVEDLEDANVFMVVMLSDGTTVLVTLLHGRQALHTCDQGYIEVEDPEVVI